MGVTHNTHPITKGIEFVLLNSIFLGAGISSLGCIAIGTANMMQFGITLFGVSLVTSPVARDYWNMRLFETSCTAIGLFCVGVGLTLLL